MAGVAVELLHEVEQDPSHRPCIDGEEWDAFAAFMRRPADANANALATGLAGTFSPTSALQAAAERAQSLNVELFERTKAGGALHPDVEVTDVSLIFEMLAGVRLGDEQRTRQLRRRYLELALRAIRSPAAEALPGPAPKWRELADRWRPSISGVSPPSGGPAAR